MGRPSIEILHRLTDVKTSNYLFPSCNVGHFSKQHRLSVPISESISHVLFDILHVDVCDPIKMSLITYVLTFLL